jgi:hypothetical protein
VAEARLIRLQTQAAGLRKQCSELQEKFDEFSRQMQRLLADEMGRRLAADMRIVAQYAALRDEERPDQRVIAGLREELDKLLSPLESIDPSANVGPSWVSAVDELAERMRKATRQYEDDLRQLELLIANGNAEPPSAQTLKEALVKRENDLALQRQKKADAKAARDREAADKAAADAEVEKQRQRLVEIEEQKRADAAEAERQRKEAQRKREYEQLKPQILALLAPLTTPDYAQPRSVTGQLVLEEKTAEKAPVSLTTLRSLGALDPKEPGLRKIALINSYKWTSRPRWNMIYQAPEPSLWSPQQFEMIRKTQEYLRKYGDLLVDEGKLAR